MNSVIEPNRRILLQSTSDSTCCDDNRPESIIEIMVVFLSYAQIQRRRAIKYNFKKSEYENERNN